MTTHNASSLTELRYDEHFQQQRIAAEKRDVYYQQVTPKIEMIVGDWHLDEFGNQAREITRRD